MRVIETALAGVIIVEPQVHRDARGFFVDVGANDYKFGSNTYYLDTVLGWSGIAVEPLRDFEAGYVTHRPRTRFRPFFVSDQSNTNAKKTGAGSLKSPNSPEFSPTRFSQHFALMGQAGRLG